MDGCDKEVVQVAWEVAAYAVAVCATAGAFALLMLVWRISRFLQRIERKVIGLADKTHGTLDEFAELTRSAQMTVHASTQAVDGFARLAEGARAIGGAAQTAADTLLRAAVFCRNRLLDLSGHDQKADDSEKSASVIADVFRYAGQLVRSCMTAGKRPDACHVPGTNADSDQGSEG
jgi:hypothetical protein